MTHSTIEDIKWLNTEQARKRLGISLRSLYKAIDLGHIKAHKFGRVIRLKESDVEAFIADTQLKPGDLKGLYPEAKK